MAAAREKLPELVEFALDQGTGCLPNAPDAAVAMFRKAIHGILELTTTAHPGDWPKQLEQLRASRRTSRLGAESAKRVIGSGNWGLHDLESRRDHYAARETLLHATYFLWTLGYDVSAYIEEAELTRLQYYLGYLMRARWPGSGEFDGEWDTGMFEGGVIDVLFACPTCGAEVLAEALEVPPANFSGDNQSESYTYGSVVTNCMACGAELQVLSTNSFGGWSLDLVHPPRETPAPRTKIAPIVRSLPPKGMFHYRSVQPENRLDDDE